MAKQDDGNKGPRKTPSTKRNIDYSKAVRVQEAPKVEEGWVEGTDPITGKKMWYRESGTQPGDKPGHPGTPPKPKSTISAPKLKPKSVTPTPGTPGKLPTKTPDTYKQEVVYMDEPVAKPEKVAVQSDVGGRSEYQENLGFYNPDFRLMEFSEAGTGGMSKAKQMYVDRKTGLPLQGDPTSFYNAEGKYNPSYSSDKPYNQNVPKSAISLAPGNEVNKDSVNEILSNTKNPVYRTGTKQELTAPLINKKEQGIGEGLMDVNKLPDTELLDKTKSPYYNQYEDPEKVTSPKFAKGGSVKAPKMKRYTNGGTLTPEEQSQGAYIQNGVKYSANGTPIMGDDVFRTTGTEGDMTSATTQPLTNGTEFKVSGDAVSTGPQAPVNAGGPTQQGQNKGGGGMGDKIGASMGWMQYANMAKDIGKSNIKRDTITDPSTGQQYSYAKDRNSAGIDKAITPYHEKWQNDFKEGDSGSMASTALGAATGLGPVVEIAYEGLYGEKKDKDRFEKRKAQFEAQTNTAQNLGARNERSSLANGGTIKGPGTGKSDSILSKIGDKGIASGSFIVPEENNDIAKSIRAKILGDNPEKTASFKKLNGGGETEADVAVSNGEHLFTPKEKEKITSMLGEEVLEKLAPEAEENDMDDMKDMSEDEMKEHHKEMMKMDMEHKAKGGELSAHKANIMLHEGKFDSDKQRRYFGWVAGGRKACGGEVKGYAKGTPKDGVDPKLAEDFKSKKRAEDLKEKEALLNEYKSLKGKNDDIARFRIAQIAKRVGEIENRYPKQAPVKSATQLESLQDTKPSPLGGKKSAPKTGSKKTGVEFVPKMTEDTGDFPVVPGTKESVSFTEAIDPAFKQKAPMSDAGADLLVTSAKKASDEYVPQTETNKRGSSVLSEIGSALEYAMPVAQGLMGYDYLNKAGKRPADAMDPDFIQSVEKAKQNAMFGFTPEEKFAIDQQNQNLTNAARFTARNLSGGSAAVAQSNERAAINDAYMRGLDSVIKGKQLQMDKQSYADQMIQAKQNKSRQLFSDTLGAWNQNQQAGASLLASGLQGLIGAKRYQETLNTMQEEEAARNAYKNIDYSKLIK